MVNTVDGYNEFSLKPDIINENKGQLDSQLYSIQYQTVIVPTGDDCQLDLDGCAQSPCSVARNCTDRLAADHEANPSLKPYTCTACPPGYSDTQNKCLGIVFTVINLYFNQIFIHDLQSSIPLIIEL